MDPVQEFLVDDYKLRVQYVTSQFDRMWRRFQFLLGIETVLAGLFFAPLSEKRALSAPAFAIMGLVVSIIWYIMGAEDKYLVDVYRDQVNDTSGRLQRALDLADYSSVGKTIGYVFKVEPSPSVWDLRIGKWHTEFAYKSWIQWRIGAISITTWVAILPLIVLAFWVVLMVLSFLG